MKSWTSLGPAFAPSSRRLSPLDPMCTPPAQDAANGSDCRAGRDRDGARPAGRLSESAPSENACAGERRCRLRGGAHAKAAVIRIEPPGAGRDTARRHAHKRPTALAARANADQVACASPARARIAVLALVDLSTMRRLQRLDRREVVIAFNVSATALPLGDPVSRAPARVGAEPPYAEQEGGLSL